MGSPPWPTRVARERAEGGACDAFFCARYPPRIPDAQTHRHLLDPDHRCRTDRHRPGMRVRLLGHPGLQSSQGGGLSDRPGQFEPGHDHDRPRSGRRDLYRADHAGHRRQDHRERTPRRGAADHGRADGAQLRAVAQAHGRARQVRRQDDRRHCRGDRQGGGPRTIPRGDEEDRVGGTEVGARQCVRSQESRPRLARCRDRQDRSEEPAACGGTARNRGL